jgi:RNA polymerase sigma-70 factor (ECF subfamily)
MPDPACTSTLAAPMPFAPSQDRARPAEALDRFLRSIERRALRHAELSCANRDDALEVLQDAMLGFVRRYQDRPEAEWPLLFWRVLDSRLVDLQRRHSVRRRWFGLLPGRDDEDPGDDPLERVPDHGEPGPLARLGDAEATAALQDALRALPLRQRQAFLLRVWEGLDVAATAAALGISEGSVKTHLFRALQSLRARLEHHL